MTDNLLLGAGRLFSDVIDTIFRRAGKFGASRKLNYIVRKWFCFIVGKSECKITEKYTHPSIILSFY